MSTDITEHHRRFENALIDLLVADKTNSLFALRTRLHAARNALLLHPEFDDAEYYKTVLSADDKARSMKIAD